LRRPDTQHDGILSLHFAWGQDFFLFMLSNEYINIVLKLASRVCIGLVLFKFYYVHSVVPPNT
jgi:hypothetical protein